jgi:hypothetical protein
VLSALRAFLNRVDAVTERGLLWVNIGLGCLVALSHGGALAISYARPTTDAGYIRLLATISLPVAAVIVATSAIALVRADFRRLALSVHGVAFAAAAMVMLLWAVSILIGGRPEGNFVWSVGMMSVLVCYATFIASRYSVPKHFREHVAIFYAPPVAFAIAVPIDVAVLVKTVSEVTRPLS